MSLDMAKSTINLNSLEEGTADVNGVRSMLYLNPDPIKSCRLVTAPIYNCGPEWPSPDPIVKSTPKLVVG